MELVPPPPPGPSDLEALAKEYIDFASSEVTRTGKTRAPTTMSSYKRAVEGFLAAVRDYGEGKALDELPVSFIESEWMKTQQSILSQTVQLRVRVIAVKMFVQWIAAKGIPITKFTIPNITTPKPKKEEPMSADLTHLADASQSDPIPSTTTYTPPTPPVQVQTTIPPPRPERAPAPAQPKATGTNPLAAMLPAPGYKLRVRRDRDLDEPVFIGDFAVERVQPFGAIEPFLSQVVGPRLASAGITGDVAFLVSPVAPNGSEGPRQRMTVTCAMGPAATPTPTQQLVNGQPAPTTRAELMEMMENYRQMAEQLSNQLGEKFGQQAAPVERVVPTQNSGEMDELRSMMRSLAGTVNSLADQVSSLRSDRLSDPGPVYTPAPAAPAAPQLDMNEVLKTVVSLSSRQSAPAAAPAPGNSMMEMFTMMKTAKEVFAPQNVQIDTTPLEERMEHLQREMAANKKDDLTEMVTKFKTMRELFGMVGGEMSAPKPTLMGTLGGLLDRVVNNPAPLADAVERILGAATALKNGQALPERPAEEPAVPAEVLEASKELLKADGVKPTVIAAHHWLGVMTASKNPKLEKIVQKITKLLEAQDEIALTVYFRQVFRAFGFEAQATNERVGKLVADILVKVRETAARNKAAMAAENGEEVEEEEEGSDAPPDMTIRVGTAPGEHHVEEDEAEGEEEVEEGDEEQGEDEGTDEEVEASEEEPSEEELEAEAASVSTETIINDPSPEEFEAALHVATMPKKRRSKKGQPEPVPTVEQHEPAAVTTVT